MRTAPRAFAGARPGQAMIETVIAVLFITFLFLAAFQVTQLMEARILADHAAARAARAKAVGFNDFMCLKSARVAVIPMAGHRLWPEEGAYSEAARIPAYLESENEAMARGILEYERWRTMGFDVDSGSGLSPTAEARVSLDVPRQWAGDADDEENVIPIAGRAEIESHFPYYMNDEGL